VLEILETLGIVTETPAEDVTTTVFPVGLKPVPVSVSVDEAAVAETRVDVAATAFDFKINELAKIPPCQIDPGQTIGFLSLLNVPGPVILIVPFVQTPPTLSTQDISMVVVEYRVISKTSEYETSSVPETQDCVRG
jgi:hypothetical protein